MAFREPMGFAPTSVRRFATGGKASKSTKATKSGTRRRRAAVVGGVRRTNAVASARGPAKKTSQEKPMAKRRRRKARTAAQKAATRRMIAANKRRKSTTRRKKPVSVRKSKRGATSVVRRGSARLSPAARSHKRRVESALKSARGRKRTTIYRTRPSGKVTKIIRENPANRTKAVVSAAGGLALGLVAADMLDRYIATRKQGDMQAPATGADAKARIDAKADGYRIFAQAAGTGVSAVGAYMARKKTVVGTYLLSGMALGFAAKGFSLLVKDYLMPKVLPSQKSTDLGKRLGYVSGPRGYMGAPRPFQGKPTTVGPQATGSVGSYGCTRVPVNPSAYFKSTGSNRNSCKPWPFAKSRAEQAIEDVGRAPHGKAPIRVPSMPSAPGADQAPPAYTPPAPPDRTPETSEPGFRPQFERIPSRSRWSREPSPEEDRVLDPNVRFPGDPPPQQPPAGPVVRNPEPTQSRFQRRAPRSAAERFKFPAQQFIR